MSEATSGSGGKCPKCGFDLNGVICRCGKAQTWRVWSLDVWGNEKDGFDVNDRSDVGRLELPAGADDKAVIRAMVEQGYLKPRFRFNVDGDGMGNMSIDHASTGRPLFQLELQDA